MPYQLDQSGKIEQLSFDTILCLSNSHQITVQVKARTKRQLQEIFRRHGQTQNFVIFTFCASVAQLLKKNSKLDHVIIDREYFGKEFIIKNILSEMLAPRSNLDIQFGLIGRRVNAHKIAYFTFTQKRKPDHILTLGTLLQEIKRTEVGKRLKNA